MSICIQVVNTPELEHLERREFNLPTIGGALGRSLECEIQLPDHSKKLSRVHARITLVDNGDYLIKDLSSNGLKVNQKALGYGNTCVLKDGDILEMADYQMFISNFDAQVKVIKNSQPQVEKRFSMGFMDKDKPETPKDYDMAEQQEEEILSTGLDCDEAPQEQAGNHQQTPEHELKKYSLSDIENVIKNYAGQQQIDDAFIKSCLAKSSHQPEKEL
ncbi:FHA domain-containing protein [Thalassomonas sp. RHCl1]|uniref:FHA domain-containing protein n=1 Tax=Thalassomonas sp. RHCl1 TaxID=2995320 RepID=UPI00248B2DB1|nr:FHA domain-containing protein [Thalassomonas sp. RHCl1]